MHGWTRCPYWGHRVTKGKAHPVILAPQSAVTKPHQHPILKDDEELVTQLVREYVTLLQSNELPTRAKEVGK